MTALNRTILELKLITSNSFSREEVYSQSHHIGIETRLARS
ncbi:hypothetical protein PORCAN_1224 [Porphyromonas crevioricanis JCM 13913]|nr:hypothetical protein PORCAN_1224 [Porphyromonas crevioricanis JCM 13913]